MFKPACSEVASAGAVASLLQLAVGLGNKHSAVWSLGQLPAARQISPKQLGMLLLLGVQQDASNLEDFGQHNLAAVVQQVSADTLYSVLQAAAARQCIRALHAVQGCSAASTVSSAAVAAICKVALQAAQRAGSDQMIDGLLGRDAVLPLKDRLSGADGSLAECMRAAISCQSVAGLSALLELQAAGAISTKTAVSIMQLAISVFGNAYVEVLDSVSKLPALQQMDTAAVQALLSTAVQQSCSGRVITTLLKVASAQQLGPTAVQQLVLLAVSMRCSPAVSHLLSLPNSKRLKTEAVLGLLQAAVRLEDSNAVQQLCELEAAHQIQPDAVHQLMTTALQTGSIIQRLIQLPGLQQLGGAALADLLDAALLVRGYDTMRQLCSLPVARIEPEAADHLLVLASQTNQPEAMQGK